MIKVEIRVDKKDLEQLKSRMRKRVTSVKKTLKRELPTYLAKIQKDARDIIAKEAFETGRLYSSILVYWNEKTMVGSVTSDQRIAKNAKGQGYSEFVEFGHFVFPYGNIKAKPKWIPGVYYMTRALLKNKPYRNTIIAKLKDSFKHYDTGGEWANYNAKNSAGLPGARLQQLFTPRSIAGKALSRMRRYSTRTRKKNKRAVRRYKR